MSTSNTSRDESQLTQAQIDASYERHCVPTNPYAPSRKYWGRAMQSGFDLALAQIKEDRALPESERPLTDGRIVAIRDDLLPSQGAAFDCVAFARAVEAEVRSLRSQESVRMAYKTGYDEGYSDASDGMVDHEAAEEGWQQYIERVVAASPSDTSQGEDRRLAKQWTDKFAQCPYCFGNGTDEEGAGCELCERTGVVERAALKVGDTSQGVSEADLREFLGKMVRAEWMKWALEQPLVKPSWRQSWDELTEPEREVDRRIGEAIWRFSASRDIDSIMTLADSYANAKVRGGVLEARRDRENLRAALRSEPGEKS